MAKGQTATSASAAHALRLVTLLAERGRLRVTEAAAELGVSASTSHRLLALMCQLGFAVQEPNRSYLPGPAYVRLNLAPSAPDTLRLLVRGHLERLAERVGETCHLMVLDGTSVRFLVSAEGPSALRVASREGALLPAHATSGGKAMLAEMSPEELLELFPEGILDPVSRRVVTIQTLTRELRKVRQQHFAVNVEESEPGISAIGAAIYHRSGSPVAALSISSPAFRFRKERIGGLVDALHATAREISAEM